MKYKILRTDKADEQLREIIFYIAGDSGSIDITLNYLDKVEKAVNSLEGFPISSSVPRYSILKKQGYEVFIGKDILYFIIFLRTRKKLLYMPL